MSVRDTWAMQCPSCGEDDDLRVTVTVDAKLSAYGTDADSDHEWDDDSKCRCGCGWSGQVAQARAAFEAAEA